MNLWSKGIKGILMQFNFILLTIASVVRELVSIRIAISVAAKIFSYDLHLVLPVKKHLNNLIILFYKYFH